MTDIPSRADSRTQAATVTENSRIVTAVRRLFEKSTSVLRGSFLYQWLTAEPDPDVIVIDLRETKTVGPMLGVLDRLFMILVAAAGGSQLVAMSRTTAGWVRSAPLRAFGVAAVVLGTAIVVGTVVAGTVSPVPIGVGSVLVAGGGLGMRDRRSWETLRETRVVRLLATVFEPPEPPAETDERQTDED